MPIIGRILSVIVQMCSKIKLATHGNPQLIGQASLWIKFISKF